MTATTPADDGHMIRLAAHIVNIPDAQEAFELIDLLREMGAINADDCTDLLRTFWAENGDAI